MDIWDILEISPTNNKKEIKKAYAKKLRVTHPDDNPEEFQKLKESFDTAILISESIEGDFFDEKNSTDKIIDISKDFKDIINLSYWKEYYFYYNDLSDVEKEKSLKNLGKFISRYYRSIPKDILEFLVDQFNLFEDDHYKLENIKQVPDFEIYFIDGLNSSENVEFFKLRYEIYFRYTYGFSNLNDLSKLLEKAEKLYRQDFELKVLKVSLGIFIDIEKQIGCKIEFNNAIEFFFNIIPREEKIYDFYRELMDFLLDGSTENIDKIYSYNDYRYIPDYLLNFIKGYVNYINEDYDLTYDYWFNKNNRIYPEILKTTCKKLMTRKNGEINEKNREIIDQGNITEEENITLEDISKNYALRYDINNWKNILEKNGSILHILDEVLNILENSYKYLPKNILDYIYEKLDLDNYIGDKVSYTLLKEIKNMPDFVDYGDKIPIEFRNEFNIKRYEYYNNSTDIINQKLANKQYIELSTISYDHSTELIRLNQLLFRDILQMYHTKYLYNTEKKLK